MKKKISRKDLKKKQEKTLEKMKKTRAIDSNMLRDLITNKLEWAETEREKGLDKIKRLKAEVTDSEKAVLRLEGVIVFINDLLRPIS